MKLNTGPRDDLVNISLLAQGRESDLRDYITARRTVAPETGCWEWNYRCDRDGYGQCNIWDRVQHKQVGLRAHRLSYTVFIGPIPEGLVIDHKCRNHCCVNPEHLKPMTDAENILIGVGIAAINKGKTFCEHGHEFTKCNTILRTGPNNTVWRACRICAKKTQKLSKRSKREYLGRVPYGQATHCIHGHAFTEENTYLRVENGYQKRQCKECKRDACLKASRKRRERTRQCPNPQTSPLRRAE